MVAEAAPGTEDCGIAAAPRPAAAADAPVFIYDTAYAQGHEPVPESMAPKALDGTGVTLLPLNVDVLVAYDAKKPSRPPPRSPAIRAGYIDGQAKAFVESSNLALSQSLAVTSFVWRYLGSVPAPAYTRSGIRCWTTSMR